MTRSGTVRGGGAGCACPENAFLKQLLSHLVIARDEWVLLDMEAGIEHLGRGTAIGVDHMIVVVEASGSSMDTAFRVKKLADEINIKKVSVIGNRVRSEEEKKFIETGLKTLPILGFIDYSDEMLKINIREKSALTIEGPPLQQVSSILDRLARP
jgi:CO dehydrogenase maturation factor